MIPAVFEATDSLKDLGFWGLPSLPLPHHYLEAIQTQTAKVRVVGFG